MTQLGTTGQRIYWLRRTAVKLQQKELATRLGVAQSLMSDVESDKRELRAGLIVKIADVLNTSADYLLLRTDDPTPVEHRHNA